MRPNLPLHRSQVSEAVAAVMGSAVKSINSPLKGSGMDSLCSVELRNSLAGCFGGEAPSDLLSLMLTAVSLTSMIWQTSRFVNSPGQALNLSVVDQLMETGSPFPST